MAEEDMDIHSALTPGNIDELPWYESKGYKSVLAMFAIVRWVIVASVFGFGVYIYQRDVNAQQTVNVADVQRDLSAVKQNVIDYKNDTEKQIQNIRKEMLTRELYEAYRTADVERMGRMEKGIELIARKP